MSDEIRALASDLTVSAARMVGPMRQVWKEIGDKTAERWAENARATSGAHGKHYPNSIDAELQFSANLSVEIGPNGAKPQGSMGRGFEFGSVNQPPHLDGLKAVDQMTPVVEQVARAAIDQVLP